MASFQAAGDPKDPHRQRGPIRLQPTGLSSSPLSSSAPLLVAALLFIVITGAAEADRGHRRPIPSILLSTDVALGVSDTHGGKSLSPVVIPEDASQGNKDPEKVPADIDDGLTLTMAINLDRDRKLRLLAVVPIFGNATLPAEMMVARQIARRLKGAFRLPIVPGALGPAGQILHPTPTWFDGRPVTVAGKRGSFASSCENLGVAEMRRQLRRSKRRVTILAIGPLTDVACLLTTSRRSETRKIEEVIVLASQLEGEPLQINDKVVNDFNFRMDPLGGTLFLAEAAAQRVPVRLMVFSLTGQTSQADDLIPFDGAHFTGPSRPTPSSQASLTWLLEASEPRNAFWSGTFGTAEGPFDQYALVAAIWPELFDCRRAKAYVLECPYPAWSAEFDASVEVPYNTPGNPCVDHSEGHPGLKEVPAQLIVSLDPGDEGALVRGRFGIDGNLPDLDAAAAEVTACIDFKRDGGASRQRFQEVLEAYTW